jgi:hypothetical protein
LRVLIVAGFKYVRLKCKTIGHFTKLTKNRAYKFTRKEEHGLLWKKQDMMETRRMLRSGKKRAQGILPIVEQTIFASSRHTQFYFL